MSLDAEYDIALLQRVMTECGLWSAGLAYSCLPLLLLYVQEYLAVNQALRFCQCLLSITYTSALYLNHASPYTYLTDFLWGYP